MTLLLVDSAAWACAVCGGGGRRLNDQTLVDMSILLSLLPLGLIGGMGYLVWRTYARPAAKPTTR